MYLWLEDRPGFCWLIKLQRKLQSADGETQSFFPSFSLSLSFSSLFFWAVTLNSCRVLEGYLIGSV